MHAAQGMEHRSGAGWLDTNDPRSTSTFCEVADEGTESLARTSQVTHPPPAAGQRGPTPEEVISNARARVSKLGQPWESPTRRSVLYKKL